MPVSVKETVEEEAAFALFFMRWQCRLRQMICRERQGQPNDGIIPTISIQGTSIGHIITLINKSSGFSQIAEMKHIARHTHDPAQRLDKAVKLFSEYYYQRPHEFSPLITASFAPESNGAKMLINNKKCHLTYAAYGQEFQLHATVKKLAKTSNDYQATWWHNYLFNPHLSSDVIILGFLPDWANSQATPKMAA